MSENEKNLSLNDVLDLNQKAMKRGCIVKIDKMEGKYTCGICGEGLFTSGKGTSKVFYKEGQPHASIESITSWVYVYACEKCGMSETLTDHISESGKMVSDSEKPKDWTEEFEKTDIKHGFEDVLRAPKLKPVDENCLYKPVLARCIDGSNFIYLGFKNTSHYLFNSEIMALWKVFPADVERIENYDYGDGGNYV